MSLLHPRLARELARARLRQVEDHEPWPPTDRVELLLDGHTFAPIGGREVTADEIEAIRAGVVEIAEACGFPARPNIEQRVRFDGRAGRFLHERMGITPHQAADEEVWSHLTLGPLVDVAVWRFPNGREENLLGRGPRSTFRRLWWRAELLGRYSWDEQDPLREDETVQIMERPELVGNPRLARALATAFLRRAEADAAVHRMNLMRDALKRAYRLSPFLRWEALSDDELGALLDGLFTQAAAAILSPAQPAPLPPDGAAGRDDGGGDYLAEPIEPAGGSDESYDPEPGSPGDGAPVTASTFDEVPLALVGTMLRAAVAAHDEVDDEALVSSFEEIHHVHVPPPRRRLFSKLAWSAKARGLLEQDESTLVWSVGTDDRPTSAFGDWTFGRLITRADELLVADPEPFDQLIHEVAGNGRAPRIIASVVGTAINEAKRSRRR